MLYFSLFSSWLCAVLRCCCCFVFGGADSAMRGFNIHILVGPFAVCPFNRMQWVNCVRVTTQPRSVIFAWSTKFGYMSTLHMLAARSFVPSIAFGWKASKRPIRLHSTRPNGSWCTSTARPCGKSSVIALRFISIWIWFMIINDLVRLATLYLATYTHWYVILKSFCTIRATNPRWKKTRIEISTAKTMCSEFVSFTIHVHTFRTSNEEKNQEIKTSKGFSCYTRKEQAFKLPRNDANDSPGNDIFVSLI